MPTRAVSCTGRQPWSLGSPPGSCPPPRGAPRGAPRHLTGGRARQRAGASPTAGSAPKRTNGLPLLPVAFRASTSHRARWSVGHRLRETSCITRIFTRLTLVNLIELVYHLRMTAMAQHPPDGPLGPAAGLRPAGACEGLTPLDDAWWPPLDAEELVADFEAWQDELGWDDEDEADERDSWALASTEPRWCDQPANPFVTAQIAASPGAAVRELVDWLATLVPNNRTAADGECREPGIEFSLAELIDLIAGLEQVKGAIAAVGSCDRSVRAGDGAGGAREPGPAAESPILHRAADRARPPVFARDCGSAPRARAGVAGDASPAGCLDCRCHRRTVRGRDRPRNQCPQPRVARPSRRTARTSTGDLQPETTRRCRRPLRRGTRPRRHRRQTRKSDVGTRCVDQAGAGRHGVPINLRSADRDRQRVRVRAPARHRRHRRPPRNRRR